MDKIRFVSRNQKDCLQRRKPRKIISRSSSRNYNKFHVVRWTDVLVERQKRSSILHIFKPRFTVHFFQIDVDLWSSFWTDKEGRYLVSRNRVVVYLKEGFFSLVCVSFFSFPFSSLFRVSLTFVIYSGGKRFGYNGLEVEYEWVCIYCRRSYVLIHTRRLLRVGDLRNFGLLCLIGVPQNMSLTFNSYLFLRRTYMVPTPEPVCKRF